MIIEFEISFSTIPEFQNRREWMGDFFALGHRYGHVFSENATTIITNNKKNVSNRYKLSNLMNNYFSFME